MQICIPCPTRPEVRVLTCMYIHSQSPLWADWLTSSAHNSSGMLTVRSNKHNSLQRKRMVPVPPPSANTESYSQCLPSPPTPPLAAGPGQNAPLLERDNRWDVCRHPHRPQGERKLPCLHLLHRKLVAGPPGRVPRNPALQGHLTHSKLLPPTSLQKGYA